MATDPNPRSHPPFRRTKKAPDIGLTLTAKIPFAVNLSWRTPSILGVDERTVGRDKDAGNPADERPDPLLFKVPAIPAD